MFNPIDSEGATAPFSMDITQIMEYEANRYPYLLIDKITEIVPGKYAKGYKNLTFNEWYFPGHFEGCPNMPGMLQIEALSHVFILQFLTLDDNKGKCTNILGADHLRFYQRVLPGDRLDIETELETWRRGIGTGPARGYVDGKLVCEARFKLCIPAVLEKYTPKREEKP